jgi:hypothetical protein
MTAQDYINARLAAGFPLHLHDGMWWEISRRGYCKPAIPYEQAIPGKQTPARLRCAIGYTHRVQDGEPCSGEWHTVIMRKPVISQVSLDAVDGKRRNCIRKGLRCCQVELIHDLSPFRNDMTDIAISTAIRNERGFPAAYYRQENEQWWNSILCMVPYTEFWGAMYEGHMIAYLAVHVAGHRAIIDGAKSVTGQLKQCPNDALVYTFLESCRERGTVDEIVYGGWSEDKPTLNRFKESFGFSGEKIPFLRRLFFGLIRCPKRAQKVLGGGE